MMLTTHEDVLRHLWGMTSWESQIILPHQWPSPVSPPEFPCVGQTNIAYNLATHESYGDTQIVDNWFKSKSQTMQIGFLVKSRAMWAHSEEISPEFKSRGFGAHFSKTRRKNWAFNKDGQHMAHNSTNCSSLQSLWVHPLLQLSTLRLLLLMPANSSASQWKAWQTPNGPRVQLQLRLWNVFCTYQQQKEQPNHGINES